MTIKKKISKYTGLNYPDFIMAGEHKIITPPLPDDPNDVFFIDEEPEDAFFNRDKIIKQDYKEIWFKFIPNETLLYRSTTEFDEDGYALTLNEEESEYIDFCYQRETKRRTFGVHFRNGTDIEWITGDHWFTLMWAKTKRPDKKGDYFDYREYQRDFFYQIFYTNLKETVDGFDWSKAKKTGITNLMWIYYLNKSTMTRNINLGCMNLDRDKAAKTFRDHFMYAYNGLPLALKPDIKSKSEAEGVIVFGKQYRSKTSKRNTDTGELNTTVMCVATAENAFDVDVFTDVWYDENPKYTSDFGSIFRSNRGATKIQDFPVGKQWLTSYTPEKSGDSFKSAKAVFYDSELKTITASSEGRTKSGLLCDHIPAYKSWATSFNKHGKCNEAEAKQKIESQLQALEDRPNEYLKKKRELANTKKDAWSAGDSSSLFDPIRLGELEFDLDELQRSTQTYEWGHLEWVNPLWEVGKKDQRPKGIFGQAKWVPLEKEEILKGKTDKWRLYERMQPQYENFALVHGRDEHNNLLPPLKFQHCGGIDPADFREIGSDEEGSMIGMYSMVVHNESINTANRRVATGIINAEYYARPENPEEWYQDIVKHIIYFGCLVIIEANNGTIATRLEDEGLGHFMLFKDASGVIVKFKANHKKSSSQLKHIRNNKAGGTDTVADIIRYIKNFLTRGNKNIGVIDYGETLRTERLIQQLKNFESADTKKYDLVMGFGYCLMTHENYLALLNTPQEQGYIASEINAVLNALQKIH
jgi:hypothetical protein